MGVLRKLYSRINWKNYPSEDTPLNETNLNRIDAALDEIDNRVISLDATTLSKTEAYALIKSFELDKATGVITITYLSGEKKTIDTLLEKVAVNFDFDSVSQNLIITLDDGTQKEVDLSAFITETEFEDTDTIAISDANHKVRAEVKDGSITEGKLQPNYLADIKKQSAIAAKGAEDSESNSNTARSYAVGGTGTRAGEDTDNAKYYAEQAKTASGITIDEGFNKDSLNPVQNRVISEWKESVDEKLSKTSGDISESTIDSIEEVSERSEITAGEKVKLIMGKIVKTFSDIKKIAFSGSAKDLEDIDILNIPTLTNNLLATEEGTALDATQGAAMKGEIDSLKSGLANFKFKNNSGKAQYSMNGGTSWTNFRNPVGTAVAADVLTGKTFANSSSDSIAGTMSNRGAWTSSPTASGKVTIPAGYHNGSGYVNTAGVYTTGYNAGKASGGFTRILSNYSTYEIVKSWIDTDDDYTYKVYAMKVATNTSKSVNDFIIEPVQGDNIFNGCSYTTTRHLYFAKAKINNNIYVQYFGDIDCYDYTMTDGLYAFAFQMYPKVKVPINVYQKS